MPRALLALGAVLALILLGCDDRPRFRAEPRDARVEDPEERAIQRAIADLAKGGKPEDPEASAAYDQAVHQLVLRGSKIELRVIDTLRSHPDPWVRLGCVEVLTAVATKAAIEHLIAVLDDPEPLVAQRANAALQVLTGQRMIAEAGQQPQEGQLPAVPERAADDLALDAEERLWAQWHAVHKQELKAAWERWWAANRATAVIR
ncbi:MAG: hypothetical protein RMM29_03275 [Planctomycetota bacterium]|nr:hypothetical protein [Planctomycetota bacterium]MCX8039237.1 hypothetical protein [Planctomycetota bacterium]MDW8372654.1 hypothetical protein [Planctomycetota bacterium]